LLVWPPVLCCVVPSTTFRDPFAHEADQFRREGAFTMILSQRTFRI
jgi:hypothetical protein